MSKGDPGGWGEVVLERVRGGGWRGIQYCSLSSFHRIGQRWARWVSWSPMGVAEGLRPHLRSRGIVGFDLRMGEAGVRGGHQISPFFSFVVNRWPGMTSPALEFFCSQRQGVAGRCQSYSGELLVV